ncbi:MAG: GNAT family N-acetyltransferase [Erysipelotrichaceae bacterium]|nr:GNAT family N-acetyltransferase [Erysipelotrichaceae bacterium]
MRVEKAGTDDIDALVELRVAYLQEDNGSLDENDLFTIQKELPDYYRRHLNRDLFVYVIRDGQDIISCAFLLIIEKPMSPAFLNGKTGTVLNVYTCPEDRRKGCANAILRTLIGEAREMEISVIELKATEEGYPLYRSLGFTDDDSGYHRMLWRNQQ